MFARTFYRHQRDDGSAQSTSGAVVADDDPVEADVDVAFDVSVRRVLSAQRIQELRLDELLLPSDWPVQSLVAHFNHHVLLLAQEVVFDLHQQPAVDRRVVVTGQTVAVDPHLPVEDVHLGHVARRVVAAAVSIGVRRIGDVQCPETRPDEIQL